MHSKVACPLCGCSNIAFLERIGGADINCCYRRAFGIRDAVGSPGFNYHSCNNCGLLFFDPLEAGGEGLYESLQKLEWYYRSDKYEYSVAKNYLPLAGDILEVGAGKAAFASVVGRQRYTGLEFNDKAIEKARQVGIRLIKQSIEEHAASAKHYAAVVSFQVLEHVRDPKSFINACVQCLDPGGLLIIAVPAHDGIAGVALNNLLDMPPHHLTHWTTSALEMVGQIFDLTTVAIDFEPVADYHRIWAKKCIIRQRLRSLCGLTPRVLDVSLRARLISVIASIGAFLLPINLEGVRGHTVVAVYEKRPRL